MLICQPFAHVVALEGRETVCDGCMRMASEVLRIFFSVVGFSGKGQLISEGNYGVFKPSKKGTQKFQFLFKPTKGQIKSE